MTAFIAWLAGEVRLVLASVDSRPWVLGWPFSCKAYSDEFCYPGRKLNIALILAISTNITYISLSPGILRDHNFF